jgi:hypothetical protein
LYNAKKGAVKNVATDVWHRTRWIGAIRIAESLLATISAA